MLSDRYLYALIAAGALAVLVSAVTVIGAKHDTRKLFVKLQALNAERDRLQVDWGRLQIEQSTWGSHGRIERLGTERLGMVTPGPRDVKRVREPGE